LTVSRASIAALVVAIIAVLVIRSEHNFAVAALVTAGVGRVFRSARAHPTVLDLAITVAAVTVDLVSIIAGIVAQVDAVSANLVARARVARVIAIPPPFDLAVLAASIAVLCVSIVALFTLFNSTVSTHTRWATVFVIVVSSTSPCKGTLRAEK
jgi:hypothetical protein